MKFVIALSIVSIAFDATKIRRMKRALVVQKVENIDFIYRFMKSSTANISYFDQTTTVCHKFKKFKKVQRLLGHNWNSVDGST